MSIEVSNEYKIRHLAETFLCLQTAPGVLQWDATSLDDWAAAFMSSDELHSARFVLGVWNSNLRWKCGSFDLYEAIGEWDTSHRRAFLLWAVSPWVC